MDQCSYVLAVVSRTVISAIKYLLFAAHAAASTSRGGMALDLENENIHSR